MSLSATRVCPGAHWSVNRKDFAPSSRAGVTAGSPIARGRSSLNPDEEALAVERGARSGGAEKQRGRRGHDGQPSELQDPRTHKWRADARTRTGDPFITRDSPV
jgi:hypothetical protein